MKRKILVTLLAFCLIASLCVVGAAAADGVKCAEPGCSHVAEANGLHYDSLNDAVAGAGSGNTITLLTDVEVGSTINVGQGSSNKNVIINLSGNDITFAKNKCFRIQAGTLTLTGEGTVKEGEPYYSPLMVYGGLVNTPNYSVVNVGADVTVEGWAGVFIDKGTGYARGVVINVDGTLKSVRDTSGAGGHGVYINGTIKDISDYSPIINLGPTSEVTSIGNGIYAAGYAVWNLEGDVEGSDALSIKSGIFNISGGTYHATGEFADPAEANGNGSENTGAAVSITSNEGYAQNIEVNISGGEFKSDNGYALYEGIAIKEDNTPAADESTVKLNVEDGIFISNESKPAIAITEAADKKVVTGGTFISGSTASDVSEYFPDNTAMEVDKDTGKVVPSSEAVAEVNGVPYKTLQAAIDAADSGDTVTLVANVNEGIVAGTPLKVEKDITIKGNGKTISLTLTSSTDSNGRDKILQVKGEKAKLTLNNVTLEITGFVGAANDRVCGDAIDLYLGGDLEANNSTIDIDGVAAAFVIQTAGETIELNNTTVTADNVRGNGSQGGEWTVNNSSISFTNCGSHGLSVETAVIDNSIVSISNAAYCGIMGTDISIINGSTVTVTGSGSKLPQDSQWAPNSDAYNYAVELKKNGELTVEDAILTLSGNVNDDGVAIDNIFVSAGTTTDTANGTVNAGFVVAEGSDQLVVRMMDGNVQYSNQTVTKGDSVYLPTLSKSGYTFTGWRVNNSNTIVKGGESYPITANTTFTAVWNMIMIPDTYDIAVDQPAHGTVDVSLSNASQGSVITVTATPDEGYELVYITVDGEPISGNSFVMPDHAVEVSALFAEIGKEVNFVDVSRADWFYDYVQYVAQNGLMEGTTRTAFEPNASMTRAMFWTVLARIDGETITGDAWKTLAQTWAVESGISDGTNADALITREQMVTMLYRYAGSPVTGGMAISEFTDGASVSDYATDAVTWALSEGILTGMGDGILAPQGTATRAQAAAMLMRFVEA